MSSTTPSIPPTPSSELVVRSDVPRGLTYDKYREYLRPDFFFSCAYCTIGESEAGGIRFTIDHYEPKRHRPDLTNDYDNLFYSCNQCNVLKGDRMPSAEMRAQGFRFFRPDQDVYADHFSKLGFKLFKRTNTGEYTIEALDLNRQQLKRLREYRQRIANCDEFVLGGVLALRRFPLDRLPPEVRGRAKRSIDRAMSFAAKLAENIDKMLAAAAHSPLIDDDEEARSRARERSTKLKQIEALAPGALRGIKAK